MADANITYKPQPPQGIAGLLSKDIEAFDALNKFRGDTPGREELDIENIGKTPGEIGKQKALDHATSNITPLSLFETGIRTANTFGFGNPYTLVAQGTRDLFNWGDRYKNQRPADEVNFGVNAHPLFTTARTAPMFFGELFKRFGPQPDDRYPMSFKVHLANKGIDINDYAGSPVIGPPPQAPVERGVLPAPQGAKAAPWVNPNLPQAPHPFESNNWGYTEDTGTTSTGETYDWGDFYANGGYVTDDLPDNRTTEELRRQGDINSARWFGDQEPNKELTEKGIASLLGLLQLQGGGYYSGTKDYGNDWSGSRSGVSGQVSTEMPINQDYLVSLMAKGYGFRNQETSPEGNKEIYSGGKPTGGGASIRDRQDRTFGVDYDRNRLRKLMFRGKIPISFFSGQRRGVLSR